jgi:cyanophycinase
MMQPKGKLLIIGGAEDKAGESPDMDGQSKEFEHYAILKELLRSSHSHKIEVITTGSRVQKQIETRYCKAFDELGFKNIGFMHIEDRKQAQEKKYATRAEKAAAIFFSGGDQFRLSTILGGTPICEIVRNRFREDSHFVAAGTSAGAMVMSKIMISEGGTSEALIKDDIKTVSGFGLLEFCIVDTHFIKRGRFGRLAHAVIVNPNQLGVGLGEDTALLIRKGKEATCIGSGMVVIIDGKDIGQTNITEADSNDTIYVDNLRVHLLVKDCVFDLEARKVLKGKKVTSSAE